MPKPTSSQLIFPAVTKTDAANRKAAREARRRRGGRPRKPAALRGMSHGRRPSHSLRHPVHVTVRLETGLPSLRSKVLWRTVRKVLLAASTRFGQMFRLVEFSVQSNHVHLIVEAHDARELSRGMQGFGIRLAKNCNARLRRKGRVLEDRYHAHALRNPVETQRALQYVRQNTHFHDWRARRYASWLPDPCSSDDETLRAAFPAPVTWLLRRARDA